MVLRTTRITVETETFTIVRNARAILAWCPKCHAEVDVIELATPSLSDPVTAFQVQQWVEGGGLHLWYSPEGTALICVTSLLQGYAWDEQREAR